ncbi:MAG: hypothetical protein HKP27_08485, partial [Myxococcales bacterium]|nr:hypothetical protein [Myxococcales bacterium]
STDAEGTRTRRAWFGEDESHDARIVRGAALSAGASVAGPAIIEEETTTLVVPPGFLAVLTPGGCYEVGAPAAGVSK